MATEIRQDTLGGCWRGGLFLLSFLAGMPLVFLLVALPEGHPLVLWAVIPAAWLFPAITLVVFWRRGYRCGVCGERCRDLPEADDKWRHLCERCDIEWQVDKPDCGAAA